MADRRESPISIRLTPDRRAWIDSQRQRGETDGAVVARLLDEYRAAGSAPATDALRAIGAIVDHSLGR